MRILLINNYDSYADLLAYTLWCVSGVKPTVVLNDARTADDLLAAGYDRIVLSPGPGHPGELRDFGVCSEVIARADVPLLGVCLGHQGLALAAGAGLKLAPEVMHGKQSRIVHDGHGLFEGVPSPFLAMRYHSWVVDEKNLPKDVRVLARARDDATVMALALGDRPAVGVQFHPESVGTVWGRRLLRNFLRARFWEGVAPCAPRASRRRRDARKPRRDEAEQKRTPRPAPATGARRVYFETLPWRDPERVFDACYAHKDHAFWLDTAAEGPGQRWSFMGAPQALLQAQGGRMVYVAPGRTTILPGGPRAAWRRILADRPQGVDDLPCPFAGGLVGWLGYELEGAGADSAALPPPRGDDLGRVTSVMQVCRRFLAFDHVERRMHVVAVQRDARAAQGWLDSMRRVLQELNAEPMPKLIECNSPPSTTWPLGVEPRMDRETYLSRIAEAQALIRRGEIYEVCLSNRFETRGRTDPWQLYRILRQIHPAPYAAFIKAPEASKLSVSPERFLTLGGTGVITTEPIKGTRAHAGTWGARRFQSRALLACPKDRSELLMIVDLLRNDLARVSERHSVCAPEVFNITEHPTVIQMSALISAQLKKGRDAVDLLQACFPGGSITGAPKRRAMRVILTLERYPRGAYTGAIGYLSCSGTMDTSVAIRTLEHQFNRTSFGAGGAIVEESSPENEWDEVESKAFALARALTLAQVDTRERSLC